MKEKKERADKNKNNLAWRKDEKGKDENKNIE